MTKPTDYSTIQIPPEETLRTELTFRQRRAELLKIILAQGHTDLPVRILSKRYGVSPGQITHDKHALVKFLAGNYFKPEKIRSSAIVAKEWALKKAIAREDYKVVNQISSDMVDMGLSLGIIEKIPDKIEAGIMHDVGSKTLGMLLKEFEKND